MQLSHSAPVAPMPRRPLQKCCALHINMAPRRAAARMRTCDLVSCAGRVTIAQPVGQCGGQPCNTGCEPIPPVNLNKARSGQLTLLFLDGSHSKGPGRCSDLTRASNAAAAGVAGVVIGARVNQTDASMPPTVDPEADDVTNLPLIDIPVGAIESNAGAPPAPLSAAVRVCRVQRCCRLACAAAQQGAAQRAMLDAVSLPAHAGCCCCSVPRL